MNGNLQKISNYIFIATPDSVELSGDFQDILAAGSAMGMDVSGLNIHLELTRKKKPLYRGQVCGRPGVSADLLYKIRRTLAWLTG